MKRNAKIALASVAVLCGVAASFISNDFSEAFRLTKLQLARNLILPFVCITFPLIIPTLIPIHYSKTLKASRVLVSILAFIVSFLASFIVVPESLTIWYSIDLPAMLPLYGAEIIVMLGTFSATVILLWPEISGRLLTRRRQQVG